MRRVSSTISHIALIALAVTALCVGTFIWIWELACQELANSRPTDNFSAEDLHAPEIESAQTSAAD